jgi:hypothetical protein
LPGDGQLGHLTKGDCGMTVSFALLLNNDYFPAPLHWGYRQRPLKL